MSRRYDSPTRRQQAEQTRARILDALVEVLVDGGPAAISIPAVAKRAGVSVRSVYHHFPSKEVLVEGIGEAVEARITERPPTARTPHELAETMRDGFAFLERHRPMIQAMVMSGLADRVAEPASVRRGRRVKEALGPVLDGLEEPHASRLRALAEVLASFDGYRALTNAGLSTEDAAEAAGWAVEVLADRARRTGAVEVRRRPGH